MKVRRALAGVAVFVVMVAGAGRLGAQGGSGRSAATARADQPSTVNDPLSAWLRQSYLTTRNRIVGIADRMPEENFRMRPGTKAEGRTFGQYLGHVANFSYLWCAQAKGEPNPNAGNDLEKLTTKSELVNAVNAAFTYCDAAYEGLTDAAGREIVDMTLENGTATRSPRVGLLILNYGHVNEVYGDLNTFMRIKDL